MKHSRKIVSLILVVMILAIPLQAFAEVPSSWAIAEIEKAKSLNLVTEKVLRDYKSEITREEFCELAVKLYESLSGKKATTVLENPFTDTSNPEVLKANSLGIVGGRGKGIFAPNDPVTRQEIAVMLLRTINAADIKISNVSAATTFSDENRISSWALEAIKLLNSHQIINGDGTKINPLGNTTKEQGIALVLRSYEKFSSLAAGNSKAFEPSEIAEKATPAMVYIETFTEDDWLIGTGSGFIIESTGKIVTNFHVIEYSDKISVTFDDGTKMEVVSIVNYDVDRDIAILQVDGKNLPTVPLGNSDTILNGQRVLAIGSPLGLSNTISEGLVSSKNRVIDELSYIQTSAPISFGSSGGALFNSRGEVVGITSAMFMDGQNLNLAIPINDLKPLLQVNKELTLGEMFREIRLSQPFGLYSITLSSRAIRLYWDYVEDAEYYHVYKTTSPYRPYQPIKNADGTIARFEYDDDYSYEETTLSAGTTVYYKVVAVQDDVEFHESIVTKTTTLKSGKMTYKQYTDHLYKNLASLRIPNTKYKLDFYEIWVGESYFDEDYIYVYYYLEYENLKKLIDAMTDGYEDEIEDLFADIAIELEEYYDRNVIAYMVFSDDGFSDYPYSFAYNSILDIFSVHYDYSSQSWSVWFPLLEIISEIDDDSYYFEWAE